LDIFDLLTTRKGMFKVFVIFVLGFCIEPAFAEHGEHVAGIESLTIPAINFGVYLLLLVFIYKKYLRVHIKNAATATAEFIKRSAGQVAEAEQLMEVADKRKDRLEDEKVGIVLKYKKEGEIQKDRIIAKALEKAAAILDEVQGQIDKELAKAEAEVEQEVFQIALVGASDKFKQMSEEQDKQLRSDVLDVMLESSIDKIL
jgi:F0F1-type ATP synthase membrane subunit b/b'